MIRGRRGIGELAGKKSYGRRRKKIPVAVVRLDELLNLLPQFDIAGTGIGQICRSLLGGQFHCGIRKFIDPAITLGSHEAEVGCCLAISVYSQA